MDAPSWHPANQNLDAVRKVAMNNGDPGLARTTYVVVDTSTEAERQMVATAEENVVLGGGRGLLDPSDRMYLAEQTQLKLQAQSKEQVERYAALQTFRSSALQMQAHKTEVTLPITSNAKPSMFANDQKKAVVIIKAKKRRMNLKGKEINPKKFRSTVKSVAVSSDENAVKADKMDTQDVGTKCDATQISNPLKIAHRTALLLQDYSSSSDDE
ncbi:uncharacterized protein PHALS_14126 [Plasmopara halstedii]|uniref:Uncharacterized protein n=1 Tax=Plasmopara halstedii TaxID=4781 RepID=A0A0P1ASN4_PLAHL|nr:uncharacterized protein PHALS_14126 [Plasmopara halstedii]CEG43837.1 hypothetical protein PHALS_14126 [Plasmopara halstedii]|eukprot:XP_024580206.1 hypothetical protein PHALS_14126 [Plasmopara halstedii]